MGEAALKPQTLTLADLIQKVSDAGLITKDDQTMINEAARLPMQNADIQLLRKLTELVRSGTVKVA